MRLDAARKLTGHVEIDDTYVGGKLIGMGKGHRFDITRQS
jgi:hypothetical protein